MIKRLFLPTIICLILPACTTFDAYTGEEKVSKTAVGAGIGASIAAVVAYIDNKDEDSRKRNQRILAAAGGGAAIGGGIGFYMDNQEAKLRKQLRNSGVSVVREGNNINLVMPGNITFATDSGAIKSNFYEILDSVAIVLNEFNKTRVVVSGHTDSTGADSYNQTLSEQRARSVADYLRSQKVLPDRLDAIGFGKRQPIADNGTSSGRQLNRRVEITLVPIAGA
ncbi:OmpA family protein [Oceanicoccus sp. KOV_DT_Chl]|uniref:OmpA family protein n=1 Tax=Oceanicoccus sp. KOV_DT_Chl TaxID=1904639 RepID=UPI0011AFBCAC|nr:OmpA family protein [Oceanicoccus sp. KOV_DT_Chl]